MSGQQRPSANRYVEGLARDAISRARPICLDSTAIIAYVTPSEPVASLIARLIDDVQLAIVLSTITLAEAVTRPAMHDDASRVSAIHAGFRARPALRIVDFDQTHAIEAAKVRALTGLKLPDAAIVATARLAHAAALIGNDRQWRTRPLGVPYHLVDDILALS